MMKRVFAIILSIAVMVTFSYTPVFAEGESEEAACEHQWSEWAVDQEATCTEEGLQHHTCELCGLEEREAIPAAGHDWNKWVVTKKCSPYHTGKKYHICKSCETKEYKTIPKRKATAKEKASIKRVKRFLYATKYHNTTKMKKCFVKCSKDAFAKKGSEEAKWARKYNKKKMKWTVKDVRTSASGKYVYVKVKVTYANGYKTYYRAYESWLGWLFNHMDASDDESADKMVYYIKKSLKKHGMKTTTTKTITVKCKHTSKGWKIVKPTNTLKNISNCNMTKATRDFEKEYGLY